MGAGQSVAKILNSKGCVTKVRKLAEGNQGGGVKFSSTAIEKILKNAYYTGNVKYQNVLYPGEHERILDDEIFLKAQETMHRNPLPFRSHPPIGKKFGLLSKLLRCKACDSSMYLAYSLKDGKKRYSHYVCLNASKRGYQECPTKLENTGLMEAKVMGYLRRLSDDKRLTPGTWENFTLDQQRSILKELVKEIWYDGGTGILEIMLNGAQKPQVFNVSREELKYLPITPKDRLIQSEPQLRQNLLLAHQIQELIDKKKAKDSKEVASWLNLSQQRVNQIISLLLLSPRIQEEIFIQNEPYLSKIPEYKLRNVTDEPDWEKQYAIWQKLISKSILS